MDTVDPAGHLFGLSGARGLTKLPSITIPSSKQHLEAPSNGIKWPLPLPISISCSCNPGTICPRGELLRLANGARAVRDPRQLLTKVITTVLVVTALQCSLVFGTRSLLTPVADNY